MDNIRDPVFYAQEGLDALDTALFRLLPLNVYRGGYPKTPQEKGATILVRGVRVTLDQWREVRMRITAKELDVLEAPRLIVVDHVGPAAHALAEDILERTADRKTLLAMAEVKAVVPPTASAACVSDPVTGLVLRAVLEPEVRGLVVTLDVLYGIAEV